MPDLPIGTDRGQGAGEEPADAALRFAADYVAASEALDELLASDTRDLDQIPGYPDLDDRRIAALARLSSTQAHDMAGLLAKARVIVLRAKRVGVDADPLAFGLATDLLAFGAG